ncbi:hypothetical protein PACTADRAFT_50732 [Pachysolen tannophilus NRRL Y-2460]|uniref:Mitochondrial intermembrane space import and assembly protein 40 n=1 Tax=Pachysolen tannophilus NRRL Y-2460 TaxID=669874 RepID=A0A1E4TT06_PACTA|nr:hypothetical protein PACTADRAFT_50732 [Pachysolen tannophilus NRRL Y-2460]
MFRRIFVKNLGTLNRSSVVPRRLYTNSNLNLESRSKNINRKWMLLALGITSFTVSSSYLLNSDFISSDAEGKELPKEATDKEISTPKTSSEDSVNEEDHSQAAAYNPETGEINWDCPCLGGMAHGPCGEEFKAAFACFVYSEADPKGIDCIEKFKNMQNCFRKYPEVYSEELRDEDEETLNAATTTPSSEIKNDKEEEVEKLNGNGDKPENAEFVEVFENDKGDFIVEDVNITKINKNESSVNIEEFSTEIAKDESKEQS